MDKTEEIAEIIVDFFNAVEAATVSAKMQIANIYVPQTSQPEKPTSETWNPDKITWEKAEGTKGPYERSEDVNSVHFKALLKDLAEHNGKMQKNGFFYWVFQNGYVVGRKPAKGNK